MYIYEHATVIECIYDLPTEYTQQLRDFMLINRNV